MTETLDHPWPDCAWCKVPLEFEKGVLVKEFPDKRVHERCVEQVEDDTARKENEAEREKKRQLAKKARAKEKKAEEKAHTARWKKRNELRLLLVTIMEREISETAMRRYIKSSSTSATKYELEGFWHSSKSLRDRYRSEVTLELSLAIEKVLESED